MTSVLDEKWRSINCFFQHREQVVVRRGQIRRIGWVIKIFETQVDQFLWIASAQWDGALSCKDKSTLVTFPRRFPSKCHSIARAEMTNTPRWWFCSLEDSQLGGCRLEIKTQGEKFSDGFLHLEFFGAGWAAMSPLHWLLLCLRVIGINPGFVPCHQSRHEIIWIAPKKLETLLRRMASLNFLNRVQTFRNPLRGELPHFQIFMNDGTNPLTWEPNCSAIDLDAIRRSSKINSRIWSIIFVLGHPERGATQVEKLSL